MPAEVILPTANVLGFAQSLDQTNWSLLHEAMGSVDLPHGVISGLTVSPGANALQSVVSPGVAKLPGLRVEVKTSVTLTHDPYSTARTDMVALRGTWGSKQASLVAIKGRSTAVPSMTQTAGDLWEMPLASRPVTSGGVFDSAGYTSRAPLPLAGLCRNFEATVDTSSSPNLNDRTIATISVPDPGRTYMVAIEVGMSLRADDGYGVSHVDVNGTSISTRRSPKMSEGEKADLNYGAVKAGLTGPSTVRLWLTREPVSMQTGTDLTILGGKLFVTRLPS